MEDYEDELDRTLARASAERQADLLETWLHLHQRRVLLVELLDEVSRLTDDELAGVFDLTDEELDLIQLELLWLASPDDPPA